MLQANQGAALCIEQATAETHPLAAPLEQVIPRVEQVIIQTTRRVIQGDTVPATDKLVSLFEPHTAIMRKGKTGPPVECGRVVWLDEVESGSITRYAVLDGNPNDAEQLPARLDHHLHQFERPPNVLVGDRKIYSPENEQYAHDGGVKHIVLPKAGRKSAQRIMYERQRWFKRGPNWRAGSAGRISVLKRRHKLRRCLYHGEAGMGRWVGWGIIAHNLHRMAQATAKGRRIPERIYTKIRSKAL